MTSADSPVKDYPLFLYEYDTNGKYGKPIDIPSALGLEILMNTTIKAAVQAGREVRITDVEDYCVFHAKDGKILWPPKEA